MKNWSIYCSIYQLQKIKTTIIYYANYENIRRKFDIKGMLVEAAAKQTIIICFAAVLQHKKLATVLLG